MSKLLKSLMSLAAAATLAVPLSATSAPSLDTFMTGEMKGMKSLAHELDLSSWRMVSGFEGTSRQVDRVSEKSGKALLIAFWSRESLSSRTYLKNLAALQQALGDDRFEVVAINTDREPFRRVTKTMARWKVEGLQAYQHYNYSMLTEMEMNPNVNMLGQFPKALLVDADGKLVAYSTIQRDWLAPEAVTLITAVKEGAL